MEIFLLLWDEIDDLLAPARLLFTAGSSRPPRIAPSEAGPVEQPLVAQPLI
jgi:hypothetical protein